MLFPQFPKIVTETSREGGSICRELFQDGSISENCCLLKKKKKRKKKKDIEEL